MHASNDSYTEMAGEETRTVKILWIFLMVYQCSEISPSALKGQSNYDRWVHCQCVCEKEREREQGKEDRVKSLCCAQLYNEVKL